MTKGRLFILSFFLLLVMTITTGNTLLAQAEEQRVYDDYGYFSSTEVTNLEEICITYGKEGKVDIVMLITNGLNGKIPKTYIEDFYDNHEYGYDKIQGDTVIILLNLEENNRSVYIQGYGNAEYYVNNDRIEYILDDITPHLKDGAYYDALELFAKEAAYYMQEETGVKVSPATGLEGSGNYYGESSYDGPSNYYGQEEDNILYNTWVQLICALVIGGITIAVMIGNSGGRITTNNRTYLNEGNSGLISHRDDYIRTTTTRVRKPQNNNNGGGRSSGGGGVSSGGHSHSGGGRSF
ncbi:MAG: TPM domain-containing protein [Anaerocolumna sp.]